MRNKIFIFLIILFLCSILFSAENGNRIIDLMKEKNIPPGFIILIISMLPIFELRLGLPLAITLFKMNYFSALLFSLLGNFIPVIPILLLLKGAYKVFEKVTPIKKFFDWIIERTEKKSKDIKKYEFWGLVIFVGIPLPGTGAWTGSLAAVILNLDFKRSLVAITLGIILASIIVSIFIFMGKIGVIIASLLLLIIYLAEIFKTKRYEK
ncbi:MAG: small multi-drug export protein [candidate division WOR-3 bacterium]